MKVCLIAPRSPFLLKENVMGPLGLWYLGAVIKASGRHDVSYCDLGLGDTIPFADAYGVTGTTPQRVELLSLPNTLRAINPDALIIGGGVHLTTCDEDGPVSGYNVTVKGEGERVILHILERTEPGQCNVFWDTERIDDLDNLPFPDRSEAHRYDYRIDGIPTTTMITTRGCPYQCAFCVKAVWGKSYFERTADNVYQEAKCLKDTGWDAIMFFDDTLAVNKKRLYSICVALKALNMKWRCLIRGDQVTEDVATAMSDAGCVEVGVGVESGSARILRDINKGEKVATIERGIGILRKAGIRVKAFFIVGLPGENEESLKETEDFILRVRPDDVDISILTVFEGSAISFHPEQYDLQILQRGGWYKGTPGKYECGVRTSSLTPLEILQARDYLESRFKDARMLACT